MTGTVCARWLLWAAWAGIAAGSPVSTPAPATRDDSLQLQAARQKLVDARGAAVHYAPRWDLSDLPAYRPGQAVSGLIRIWGSNYITDGKLGAYWMEAFRRFQPGISFAFHTPTSGVAITGLVARLADIGVNHKIMWKELLVFQREFKHDPLELVFANGSLDVPGWAHAGLAIVNAKNPLKALTLRQLDGIFGAERSGGWLGTQWHREFARGPQGNIRTWGELGLQGEWRDQPIHVYMLNLKYDAADDLSRWVLQGSDKWNEQMRLYANYSNPDGSFAFGEKLMVEDMARDPCAIGFGPGLGDLVPAVKAVALAAQDGGRPVYPTLETCRDGSYPFHEEAYFYVDRTPGQPVEAKTREFLRFVLSREGQAAVQRDGKYLPLTAEMVREQLKKLE